MIYFYSDPHFSHSNIIKYQNRPFENIEEMNKELIKRYNSVVKETDHCYILGDLFVERHINDEVIDRCNTILSSLNGQKTLIRGNHDPMKLIEPLSHHFIEIVDKKMIKIGDKTVNLHHYPIPNTSEIVIHGHDHSDRRKKVISENGKGSNINLTCDLHDFYPLNEEQVLDIIRS